MATPPKKPTDGAAKPPAPRKPATPRKTTTRKTAASATPKTVRKAIDTVQDTGEKIAATAERAASSATEAVSDVVKTSTPRKSAAKRSSGARKTSNATPKAKRPSARATAAKSTGTGTGRRWGIAAAVTAAGAVVTAGLLALRGSTPAGDDPAKPNEGGHAHQADGTDSSKSFEAGIADEGTIPE